MDEIEIGKVYRFIGCDNCRNCHPEVVKEEPCAFARLNHKYVEVLESHESFDEPQNERYHISDLDGDDEAWGAAPWDLVPITPLEELTIRS